MSFLREQFIIFIIAIGFLTRIPIAHVNFTKSRLNKAARYFPAVGMLVGCLCALVYFIAIQFLSKDIAIILSMIFGFYVTGGFHEDGLADVCDGFGGASVGDNQIHKKLSIMKDSSIGTFGGLGLFSILLLKFSLLSALNEPIYAMILMHTLSRAVATSIIYSLNYATADAVTKTKPLAEHLNLKDLIFILGFSVLILFGFGILYISFKTTVTLMIILALTRLILIKWFYKHLRGYTGDCLGFAQQTTEIMGYITLSATLLAL